MSKNAATATGGLCLIQIIIMAIFYIPICLWTDRNLDFYASQSHGVPVDVSFWWAALLSLFEPIVVLDIIGEIIRQVVL